VSVDGAGQHELRWVLYSKSGSRPAYGTIVRAVPDEADRPPFGRLAGITSFPDVPILDEDHEIVHDMRVRDPPARPQFDEANPDGLVERLHQAGEVMAWDALV
jgi:hypothetical protein